MPGSAVNRLKKHEVEAKDKGYSTEHVPSLAELEAEVDRIDARDKVRKEAKKAKKTKEFGVKGHIIELRDKSRKAIEKAGG